MFFSPKVIIGWTVSREAFDSFYGVESTGAVRKTTLFGVGRVSNQVAFALVNTKITTKTL